MSKKVQMTKDLLLDALERSLGIITTACKHVNVSRQQFYNYYKDDEVFRAKVEEINEMTLDFVESQLYRKIKEGSERSIHFYMKHKGKKRGYTDSLNINASLTGNIDISKLVGFDDEDDENT